ncbi:vegetative incompatibility protein HET-E-1 [Podospora aff. communis PSN243]|uniref:Vegetative incompatibility protein HET-E-1 n=1 Tax=Podospora aff. communis PSN243 TaxID=3040156 RepID=A0AAV9G6Y0_9PEZI|nr:vegetative incompatibility protein HET-E-1 [Podospora aff. communis PSN243]
MRLLNTRSVGELKEFIGDDSSIPPYAILSHTWEDEEEVTFETLGDPTARALKRGFLKIQRTCALAAQNGYDWAWVDTCCIDKKASAELSEAINSMFRWYQNAAVCYVFLADLEPGTDLNTSLPKCRWFTRGWTLQELIAPRVVLFYDRDWNYRGTKDDLADIITRVTRIPIDILAHQKALCDVAVACRMSWVSRRSTTRVEDMTYCLLGIFDVHMSLIYGERHRAFSRLQEAIIQATGDLSIFVWANSEPECPEFSGFFADSPRHFEHCSELRTTLEDSIYRDLKITTRGICLKAGVSHLYLENETMLYQPVLDSICMIGDQYVGVYMRNIGGNRYARWKPHLLAKFEVDPGPDRKAPWASSASVSYGIITKATASVVYKSQKLRVEKLVLPMGLPGNFPFHPTDPILGSRHSALRMAWKVEDSLPLEPMQHRVYPRSHWDSHDRVFVCTNKITYSWCASFLEFEPSRGAQHGPGQTRTVGIFVACFYWNLPLTNRGEPFLVIAPLNGIDGPTASAFEFNLGKVKFECARSEALSLIRRVFGDSLLADYDHRKSLSVAISDNVEVTVSVRGGVDSPDVCVNPITCVDIFVGKRAPTAPNAKVGSAVQAKFWPRVPRLWQA